MADETLLTTTMPSQQSIAYPEFKDRLVVYSYRGKSQDDSVLSRLRHSPLLPLRRRGSSESGFFRYDAVEGKEDYDGSVNYATLFSLFLSHSVGDVERMSACSDLSPEFLSRLSLDDGSFLTRSSRIGSYSMSDSDEAEVFSLRLNRSFSSWTLFNRSSSVYTSDSSEDLASLGDACDGSDRSSQSLMRRLEYGEKDISKIVDYFERYIRGGGVNGVEPLEKSSSGAGVGSANATTATTRSTVNPALTARIRQFQNWRHEDKIGRDKLLASQLTERLTAASGLGGERQLANQTQPIYSAKKHVSQRLKVCEGAVQSKLSLFDSKKGQQQRQQQQPQ